MPKPIAMAPANAASVRSSHTNQTRSIDRHSFRKYSYKARARIEQAVGKLKRFKRIALRCEKTAQNYASFGALALGFILIKSVHTT
jgi:transposase